jgi:hypothetical protein
MPESQNPLKQHALEIDLAVDLCSVRRMGDEIVVWLGTREPVGADPSLHRARAQQRIVLDPGTAARLLPMVLAALNDGSTAPASGQVAP